jgi:hypothetical protein
VVDDEATLLVTPEKGYAKTTPFEAWRPMLEDLGDGDAYEWTVASAAWAAEWAKNYQSPFVNMSDPIHGTPDMFPHAQTPWPSTDGHLGTPLIGAAKHPWNPPTSIEMKAGESRRFALRLQLAPAGGPRQRNNGLQAMGEPVLRGVPGYVVSEDMTTAKLLVLPPPGSTVTGATATNADSSTAKFTIGSPSPAVATEGNDVSYTALPLSAISGRGRVRVEVKFSDSTTSVAHYYVLPGSLKQSVDKIGQHWANDAWLPRDYVDPFGRSASMMPWDR